jgi:hypothetical protein
MPIFCSASAVMMWGVTTSTKPAPVIAERRRSESSARAGVRFVEVGPALRRQAPLELLEGEVAGLDVGKRRFRLLLRRAELVQPLALRHGEGDLGGLGHDDSSLASARFR